jgi:CheY-like chemotaxis protein
VKSAFKKTPHVLIIEDDPGHQRLLQLIIQKNGASCDCAFDGKAGLEKATTHDYDMIFVDINIPQMDGFMLATRLRDMGYTTPLVAITALKLQEIERKALAVGFNAFVVKPIKQDTIDQLQHQFLKQKVSH